MGGSTRERSRVAEPPVAEGTVAGQEQGDLCPRESDRCRAHRVGSPRGPEAGFELGLGPEGGAEGRSRSASTPDGPAPERGPLRGLRQTPRKPTVRFPSSSFLVPRDKGSSFHPTLEKARCRRPLSPVPGALQASTGGQRMGWISEAWGGGCKVTW